MGFLSWGAYCRGFVGAVLVFAATLSCGDTDVRDVYAINDLYYSLGFPPLGGWMLIGGDPCYEQWQGVHCVNTNITGIVLIGQNLTGELSNSLGNFTSLIKLDLSNNRIGGHIPSSLPTTTKQFFLSGNNFSGSIPDSFSSLTQLTDMSLSNNRLAGEIPDVFFTLSGLLTLDLSGNKLRGQLPPSLANLISLVTLNLQDNRISGFLDVLQDLPLRDLNIENNLFSGPIPLKMLSIPNFKKDGNPFNTSVIPPSVGSPAPSPAPLPEPPQSGGSSSGDSHGNPEHGPPMHGEPNPEKTRFFTTKRIVWIGVAGGLVFIIISFGIAFCVSKARNGPGTNKNTEKRENGASEGPKKNIHDGDSLLRPVSHVVEVSGVTKVVRSNDDSGTDVRGMGSIAKQNHGVEKGMQRMGPPKSLEGRHSDASQPPMKALSQSASVKTFTIGSLQQFTNSFSEENLMGRGVFGSVYRAELPDGKLLAVKNLKSVAYMRQNNEQFLDLVSIISRLQHVNVLEFVGYCADHGQQLLIYEYCSNGTLHDAIHSDGLRNKLSWNARVQVALGSARALEYLHEVCQPPTVHQSFRSTNILLDNKFTVRVSECGFATIVSSNSISQVSGKLSSYGYEAPEFEKGSYTFKSDIYSFGVVLLELLTGRKPYDRSKSLGEQFLAAWAVSQLHDINALSRMVDPSLHGAYPMKSVSRFADIISLCLQSEPEFRPPMSEIVQILSHMT
ncbi:hypothetical protein Syun_008312 [Stephania yunnanensis]|uniref:Protein kinase domain-containing protein n=1 Tax=Stephania yunnanensis TaxID=152371 RepID=A0AAP0KE27_9MAGN